MPDDAIPPAGPSLRLAALNPAAARTVRHVTGRHVAGVDAMAALAAPLFPAGLVVGRDRRGSPVVVRLFRPEPTHVALVGGGWAARLLAFRALAVGACVTVVTTAAGPWRGLGEAAGRADAVAVAGPRDPVPAPAAAPRPTLAVTDLTVTEVTASDAAVTGLTASGAGRPMLTRLTLVPRLTALAADRVRQAQLVLLQRLTADEAAIAAQRWNLEPSTAGLLQEMDDDMLAIVGGEADRYVWTHPTGIERRLLGPPTAERPARH